MKITEENSEKKELRPYQSEGIRQLRQSIASGKRRVVMQGATGFGKTLVAANIITGAIERGNSVTFTVPAISLIDQTVAAFEAYGIRDIGVMQADHPRTNQNARIQVASVQTLARREIPKSTIFIIDECHIRSEVVDRLMDENPDTIFIGLSATPWAKGMGLRWQDLIIPCTLSDLINDGYLSKFRAFSADKPDLSGVRVTCGEYSDADLTKVMSDKLIVANILETWLEKGGNRPTFAFCVNRAHADELHRQFQAYGIASAYVDMYTDRIEMAALEEKFRSGEIRVVFSVIKMTTGIDWPVSCIIDAAPTKSEMRHVQKIGRGLRINPGTEDLLILDHAGNSLSLGLVTNIVADKLDDTPPGGRRSSPLRKKAESVECPKCKTVFSSLCCPECGYERRRKSHVREIPGILTEMDGQSKPPTKDQKQVFWSMALWIDNIRNKNGKLAKALYRSKFGVWPRGLKNKALPADESFMNYDKSRRIAYAKSMNEKQKVENENVVSH